jgi:NAD(P)-dependent dehydrogenase (short-subunit alcohol dehydrogenase family)
MGTMTGKVALVTGGSTGIGKATALAFAEQGASVVIASRRAETGQAVAQEITQSGGKARWIKADVTKKTEVEALIGQTMEAFGQLDCAFNNAGSGGRGGWIPEIKEEDWDQTIDGYLKSVWLCMKYEIPELLKTGGAIVNNSSVDGRRAFPWDPAYSAAKHGVIGLTKSAAMQYADKGVRINAVCPGWIRTPPVEELMAHDADAEARMIAHQPIGRLGRPEEVAQAVVWLCSEQASMVVGAALPVDGGYLIV